MDFFNSVVATAIVSPPLPPLSPIPLLLIIRCLFAFFFGAYFCQHKNMSLIWGLLQDDEPTGKRGWPKARPTKIGKSSPKVPPQSFFFGPVSLVCTLHTCHTHTSCPHITHHYYHIVLVCWGWGGCYGMCFLLQSELVYWLWCVCFAAW